MSLGRRMPSNRCTRAGGRVAGCQRTSQCTSANACGNVGCADHGLLSLVTQLGTGTGSAPNGTREAESREGSLLRGCSLGRPQKWADSVCDRLQLDGGSGSLARSTCNPGSGRGGLLGCNTQFIGNSLSSSNVFQGSP